MVMVVVFNIVYCNSVLVETLENCGKSLNLNLKKLRPEKYREKAFSPGKHWKKSWKMDVAVLEFVIRLHSSRYQTSLQLMCIHF